MYARITSVEASPTEQSMAGELSTNNQFGVKKVLVNRLNIAYYLGYSMYILYREGLKNACRYEKLSIHY